MRYEEGERRKEKEKEGGRRGEKEGEGGRRREKEGGRGRETLLILAAIFLIFKMGVY